MGHRVVSAQQDPRIPLIARHLRSRRFPGPGLRALVASASNPPASAKHRGIGAAASLSEVVKSRALAGGVASNGTVQAKTWNPNGLAAVANLPCGYSDCRCFQLRDEPPCGLIWLRCWHRDAAKLTPAGVPRSF